MRRYATTSASCLPGDLLTRLPAGSGLIFVRTAAQKIVEVDDWDLLVSGYTNAVNTELKSLYGTVTLE